VPPASPVGVPPASPVVVPPASPVVAPPASAEERPVAPLVEAPPANQLASVDGGPRARSQRARVAPTVPSLDPAAHSEAAEIATAFRQLRSAGDPAAALRTLDRYQVDHPTGALRSEARVARAEALIELGRRREALPLLDEIDGRSGPPTRNVRLTRAELHAEMGQCRRARADFDVLADGDELDDTRARALSGRASCRRSAGDAAGARQDLETYLRLFPGGPFAAVARRALDLDR